MPTWEAVGRADTVGPAPGCDPGLFLSLPAIFWDPVSYVGLHGGLTTSTWCGKVGRWTVDDLLHATEPVPQDFLCAFSATRYWEWLKYLAFDTHSGGSQEFSVWGLSKHLLKGKISVVEYKIQIKSNSVLKLLTDSKLGFPDLNRTHEIWHQVCVFHIEAGSSQEKNPTL